MDSLEGQVEEEGLGGVAVLGYDGPGPVSQQVRRVMATGEWRGTEKKAWNM